MLHWKELFINISIGLHPRLGFSLSLRVHRIVREQISARTCVHPYVGSRFVYGDYHLHLRRHHLISTSQDYGTSSSCQVRDCQ